MSVLPRVVIDLKKVKSNTQKITKMCKNSGIDVAGVIKGYTGILECTKAIAESGVKFIASSRLEQLELTKKEGVNLPLMMIRTPMISEVKKVIELAEYSLNSEISVLYALDEEARKQNKIHNVILMIDLGDLREGYWDKTEFVQTALIVENELESIHLSGTGTNLGCYGSIVATPEKLIELVECTEEIEKKINRKMEIISGGATNSLPRILEGNMPKRINHLRLGEGIITARDLEELYGYDFSFMDKDCFVLEAEVIEIKDKPSYPVGTIGYDAFGQKQVYEDKGIRKRAIVGVGKVDYAFTDQIRPRQKGMEVIGASSDHTILDIENAEETINVGDVISFDLTYASTVFLTNSSNVKIKFIN